MRAPERLAQVQLRQTERLGRCGHGNRGRGRTEAVSAERRKATTALLGRRRELLSEPPG